MLDQDVVFSRQGLAIGEDQINRPAAGAPAGQDFLHLAVGQILLCHVVRQQRHALRGGDGRNQRGVLVAGQGRAQGDGALFAIFGQLPFLTVRVVAVAQQALVAEVFRLCQPWGVG